MRKTLTCGLLLLTLFTSPRLIDSQTNPPPYNLSVAVDEVDLTFHASDIHGLSVDDLKLGDLTLLDNDKPPRRTLLFESKQNLPIRAGILMDTSQSMEQNRPSDRAIAVHYAQKILRQQTDQAFVMSFGKQSVLLQPWTSNPALLTAGIDRISSSYSTTAIFDALYAACRYQFGETGRLGNGNFILLFSDGEDNASFLTLKDAVDMCQHTHTAIYVFRAETGPNFTSSGLRTLADLARQTGGRTFHDDDSEAEVNADLLAIESELRNQYRIVYNPAELRHDGTFHRIELRAPDRVDRITIRSGYYAPSH